MEIISLIIKIVFYLIVVVFTFLSLLGMFIVVKYGRSHVATIFTSLIYLGLFSLLTLSAILTLQQL